MLAHPGSASAMRKHDVSTFRAYRIEAGEGSRPEGLRLTVLLPCANKRSGGERVGEGEQ